MSEIAGMLRDILLHSITYLLYQDIPPVAGDDAGWSQVFLSSHTRPVYILSRNITNTYIVSDFMLDFLKRGLLASFMERSRRLQNLQRTFFDVQCSIEMLGQIGQSEDSKRPDLPPPPELFKKKLCSLFSPNIIPSREIPSVEKPAMLMVAIAKIKCNTLLYATRFIQLRHSQCKASKARHNV